MYDISAVIRRSSMARWKARRCENVHENWKPLSTNSFFNTSGTSYSATYFVGFTLRKILPVSYG